MSTAATLPVPAAASFVPDVRASFDTGTDGQLRTTWRRSYESPLGFGWDAARGTPYAIGMGGRPAREAFRAANVAAELATSNPVIATMIETLTTNAVGTGLTLSSKPDVATLGISAEMGRAISHAFETGWRAWSTSPLECDATGRFDLHAQAACFFKTWLQSGEGLAAIDWKSVRGARTKTKVCLLDPRQIDPTVYVTSDSGSTVAGVVFDKGGRLAGYMIRDVPIAGLGTHLSKFVQAFTSWGRPRIIHAFEPIDAKQVRGLSPLVAALTPANERESLAEFGIVNALIQTQYALTIESDLPPAQALGGLNAHEPHVGGTMPGIADFLAAREAFYGQTTIKMSPGVVNHLPPGDKLRMNKVANAGDAFDPFNRSLTMSAARAGGAMVEEISGDYSKTSFSASRLAQELPFRLTQRRRKLILERFYGDVFGAYADEAIETRAIVLPDGAPDYWKYRDAYLACRWLGIGRAEPDRKKAAEADALELELGLVTFEDALAARGLDLETHLANVKSERMLMREAGLDKPFFPGTVSTQNRREVIEEAPEEQDGEIDRNA